LSYIATRALRTRAASLSLDDLYRRSAQSARPVSVDSPSERPMDKQDPPISHGVFKPVGHVVISFPPTQQREPAMQALQALGLGADEVTPYTAEEMSRQVDTDMERATGLASLGQELNLVKAHGELAALGYHFLIVRVDDDAQAHRVAEAVRPLRAERAQYYGRFVIEELIAHADDEPQVAESPDRGLDAQTPSGLEGERAQRHDRS
jgi:hypothetical protein